MDKLRITSFLGANTFPLISAVAGYLSHRLDLDVEFVNDISGEEKEHLLDKGHIQLGWMCGLLYVMKTEFSPTMLELLAAPVMSDRRYQDRPVYFSDIVVRRNSPFQTFTDLRGSTWAFNETHSYSGYLLVVHHLVDLAETPGYFGRLLETGTHANSLHLMLDNQADVAAIDSTILDYELAQRPELADQIRVIETLGPSPVPPWVISKQLPVGLRQRIRQLLLEMDTDPSGRASLVGSQLSRFASARDANYNPIRQVAQTVNKHKESQPRRANLP